ncbi:MAG: YitT family protein [Oscillospiraceae bacterium]|jgi:uncharacterized membrane-anchored protein YitT (DUF2179 family)
MNRKHPVLQELYHGIWLTVTALIFAISYNWFFAPNNIAFGGVTGIAMAINGVFGAPPVGILMIAMNIPLFLIGWRFLGKQFLFRSLYTTILSSVLVDVVGSIYTFPTMDPLLASLYGGLLLGVAYGVIFRHGGSTGGVNIGARLLKLKFAHLPMGQLLLLLDLGVIGISALAFGEVNSALYGLVSLYISTVLMDFVLYGMNKAKFAYVISDQSAEVAAAITQGMSRGVTILQGQGAFSGEEKRVLLCAFKKHQIMDLKRMVKEIDPDAFLIVSEAYEVLGVGFDEYKKNAI